MIILIYHGGNDNYQSPTICLDRLGFTLLLAFREEALFRWRENSRATRSAAAPITGLECLAGAEPLEGADTITGPLAGPTRAGESPSSNTSTWMGAGGSDSASINPSPLSWPDSTIEVSFSGSEGGATTSIGGSTGGLVPQEKTLAFPGFFLGQSLAMWPGCRQALQRPRSGHCATRWSRDEQWWHCFGCPGYQRKQGKPETNRRFGIALDNFTRRRRVPVGSPSTLSSSSWYDKMVPYPSREALRSFSGTSKGGERL